MIVNPSLHKNRINIIQNKLKQNELLVLFAASHKVKNRDVEYKFRQDSDYYYLTGIKENDGIFLLKNDLSVHFSLPKDKEKEIWTGKRMGKDLIKSLLDLNESYDLSDWESKKSEFFTNIDTLYYFFGKNAERDREILSLCDLLQKKLREGKFGPSRIELPEFLHEERMIKSPEELEIIKEAVRISVIGHKKAMAKAKPGMFEYELEAILEKEYLKNGAFGGGYGHIVASGINATVLHYTENNKQIQKNELILIDSGAEKDYYTADITRTFPSGKKFSDEQKEIYELVLASQLHAISLTTEGTPFLDIHTATVKFLSQGLKDLNLLSGSIDEILEKETFKKFYMHRTGHWLGMDVHDVGRYYKNGTSRPLQSGQITTVEPGLYFDPNDYSIPEKYRGIGIRIEDDVLVNGNTPIILTEAVPKTIEEIENLRKS
jgi:Xaa-Pro aminopeptidase